MNAFWQKMIDLNTHATANAGIGGVLVAIAIQIAAKATANQLGLWPFALAQLDTYVATPLLIAGAAGAYVGRPKTIPSNPQADTPGIPGSR